MGKTKLLSSQTIFKAVQWKYKMVQLLFVLAVLLTSFQTGSHTAIKVSTSVHPLTDSVQIIVKPQTVFIEQGPSMQNLNFDFILTNLSTTKLFIREIELSVFDQSGKLAFRDFRNPYERS
jgi:hypothetical protein